MIQEDLKKIIEYVTGPEFTDEIYKAKQEYKIVFGEIYEDDHSFENRIDQFLEWYTFDRNLTDKTITPLMAFLQSYQDKWTPEISQSFLNFSKNVHSIFIVKKIRKDHVIAINLFDKTKYKVMDNDSELIFKENPLFEGRLVPSSEAYRFTGTFCFHPQETLKFIKKEIDKQKEGLDQVNSILKKLGNQKKGLLKEISKLDSRIQVWKLKILATDSAIKKIEFDKNKQIFISKKQTLEENLTQLNQTIYEHFSNKVLKESPKTQTQLIHKLSYMNLKWERFRQIDIKDIYKN